MTAYEFYEWQLFSIVEPFGSWYENHRFGTIAAQIINVNLKKGKKPLQSTDFFPSFAKRFNSVQTWQEQLTIVEMLNQAFGGKDLRTTKEPTEQ